MILAVMARHHAGFLNEREHPLAVLALPCVLHVHTLVEILVAPKGRVLAELANNWTTDERVFAVFAQERTANVVARHVRGRSRGLA